jgi:hypothetical protein
MARAAGSKSIGLFVRQKLLSTLGLAGSGRTQDGEQIDSAELKVLTAELKRLHRELQLFLADSTPATSLEATLPFPKAVEENFLAEGAPLLPEPSTLPDDQLISPRSGKPLPYSIPMPPPDEIQSFADVDEMENLADRAFAISPRLGALDEPAPKPFPDPLKDLLDDALADLQSAQEEEEEEEQPQEAESEPEEALQEEPEVTDEEEIDESVGENEDEYEEDEAAAQTYDEADQEDEIDEDTDSEQDEPPAPQPPPPMPPNVSGGPPPRKRHT